MSQLSYALEMSSGQAGDFADGSHKDNDVATYRAVNDLEIKPGLVVAKESGVDDGVKVPSGSTDLLVGVAVRDITKFDDDEQEEFLYKEGERVPVARKAEINVICEQDVTPDDAVFVRFQTEPEVFTVTFDIDFVASNLIDGTVGEEAIVQVPFDTDQATTLAALAAEIEALDSVDSATVTDTREITVTGATGGEDLSSGASFTVTAGASQAVDTIANVTGPSDGNQPGAVRSDDDDVGNGANAVALPQANFITDGSAGGIVKLDVNLP